MDAAPRFNRRVWYIAVTLEHQHRVSRKNRHFYASAHRFDSPPASPVQNMLYGAAQQGNSSGRGPRSKDIAAYLGKVCLAAAAAASLALYWSRGGFHMVPPVRPILSFHAMRSTLTHIPGIIDQVHHQYIHIIREGGVWAGKSFRPRFAVRGPALLLLYVAAGGFLAPGLLRCTAVPRILHSFYN